VNTSYLYPGHFDLVSPDGVITKIQLLGKKRAEVELVISSISAAFLGFQIDADRIQFNFKSTLAQLGLNAVAKEIVMSQKDLRAEIKLELHAISSLAEKMLPLLQPGAYIGKLFAADDRRCVRDSSYLSRMFGRCDRKGRPLLLLGGLHGPQHLVLEKIEGRTVAFLPLQDGNIQYNPSIEGLLPTLAHALQKTFPLRDLIRLHQFIDEALPHLVEENQMLLVSTLPLHIRTVFARVVDSLLPKGVQHTSANVLQPDTLASGDIYEFYGHADEEISDIPLEFFTLEPHREHVFFTDRDQLQISLDDNKSLFEAFETAPKPEEARAAVFIVKGTQLQDLKPEDWIATDPQKRNFPGTSQASRQAHMVAQYIGQQPSYPFLKAIETGLITSQGVLFTRYFPSPLMKRMLVSYHVEGHLMGLYFERASGKYGEFFSQEDRAMLTDLTTFGIPVFWVDRRSGQLLEYVQRLNKASGMFVPLKRREEFSKASFFGIYGSSLVASCFEDELFILLQGLLEIKDRFNHPLFNAETPLALVTGGGPGAMEVGNRVAQELNILSCANIVDFQSDVIAEQKQNPYVDAKMTYRLDRLIERQAEFYLDFPIFVMGGVGTDFEYSLEHVRQKVGARTTTPILLFGHPDYWRKKITNRFQCNLETGTLKGSEWIGNSFFCVQTAKQGLEVYKQFFSGKLQIGRDGPIIKEGFRVVP